LSLTDTIYVRAYVDEPSLGKVVPGAEVVVTTDSSSRQYVGRVGFISPRAEFTPKTVETPELRTDLVYRLRIVIPEADDALRQGMPVTVAIPPA
jgi:HlyD family secretion protein